MSLRDNIIQIWKAKGQIIEGVANSIFKREDVEDIAKRRMNVCLSCKLYTEDDKGCLVSGTGPCCNQQLDGCGCSLSFKTRSLSSDCPQGHWKAEVTQEEEDLINQKLGI
jgi:hypothetical protein